MQFVALQTASNQLDFKVGRSEGFCNYEMAKDHFWQILCRLKWRERFFQSTKKGLNFGRLIDDLRNVFATRSSNTLHSRSGPILRYLAYCSNAQLEPFPLVEEQVYRYMQDVEQQSAPTYLRSFLSSLGFCFYVIGLTSAKSVVESPRVKGLATKCFLNKRKTKARWPLTVSELQTLENIVCGHTDKSVVDRHVAGCFLFMVYARGAIQRHDEC